MKTKIKKLNFLQNLQSSFLTKMLKNETEEKLEKFSDILNSI